MEEELYRVPGARRRRGLADQIAKFSLCFALADHEKMPPPRGRHHTASGLDVAGIKAGILAKSLKAGDEVEGEGIISRFAAIYRPRAYYPSYFLGEMRAELRRGAAAPQASPHYLPVSDLPPLPDGSYISFLFPGDKLAFDRPDFPSDIKDVLTRDFPHMPIVAPDEHPVEGKVRFRARLRRLGPESMLGLAGVGERPYESYSARGLTHFLEPVEIAVIGEQNTLRGSLFAEITLPGNPGWEAIVPLLEDAVHKTVEDVFPGCARGEREELSCYLPRSGHQVVRFRRRLLGLVFDPVVVIFRSPNLLGLYLPGDLLGDIAEAASAFERFVLELSGEIEGRIGAEEASRIEIAYDNRLPWAAERGALRGRSFRVLAQDYPFLERTIEWLRG